ncbi:Aryl-alcohol dehydrogenase [Acrodontium crateriforme]|uniref:Aryl-alcohol dehydrogenase n=1 Tax=Acrodontium crateriforme TaxID=150365 RepID=A0AAQ3R9Y0_9PEZI|nr:Aryl-alcohol dehydrogenase [Acrodontium crateriforme]
MSNPTNTINEPNKPIETIAWVVHNAKQDFKLEAITLDQLHDDELLVEMKYSGICHTDLVFQQGQLRICEYPAVFGHEGAGTIRAIGPKVKNKSLKTGDFVLLSMNFCETCMMDELHLMMEAILTKMIGAGTVMNILKPEPESSIVIFGLGTVGLTALMAAKYLGVRQIIAVDIQESKFDVARELGATDIVNSKEVCDMVSHIQNLTSGGADYCVDCTGVLSVIEDMLNCLGMQGTAATVGVPPSGAKIIIDPLQFLLGSKRYIGCREGDSVPTEFIPRLVEMQRSGQFPVEKICKVYDYKDMAKALDDLHHGKVIKPVIQWS